MIVQELLQEFKDDKDAFLKHYIKNFPLFEDYEIESYGEEKINEMTDAFLILASKRFDELLEVKPVIQNEVVFVLKHMNSFIDDDRKVKADDLVTFMCKIDQIEELAKEKFSLWNDDYPRIEHYAYDFSPVSEILGMEVFFTVSRKNAMCTIFHEMIEHGLTEESSEERKQEIFNDLEEGLKQVKEGDYEYLSADEVFKQLEDEIFESASDDEKEEILKQREEKKKNENRDNMFLRVSMEYNHNKSIAIIQKYYLSKVANGEFKL